ncbi:MAG: hypothetical protein ACTIIH_07980 [Brevibacterium sp.]|uniref:hypothetical protein n=1 Tax=Brevibacterium sp. TaxID=1701 RepID=UPI003F901A9A
MARRRNYASSDRAASGGSGPARESSCGAEARPRRGGRHVADGGKFSYLTGHALFDIHGWRVEISRRRAQIVRFDAVSASGFSLSGTGSFRVRTPGLFEPKRRYDITVSGPSGDNAYQQRADKKGRLTFTGRLAAAMHDPIIPGKRTAHFTTLGQDEVTTVGIASAPEDEAADRRRSTVDVPGPTQTEITNDPAGVSIESGRESSPADPSER